jgi:hypothetical protein
MSLHPRFAEWRTKLDTLLEEARTLAKANSHPDDRRDLRDRLHKFILRNPDVLPDDPGSEVFGEMDDIARGARDDLLLQEISSRIDRIAERTYELGELEKRTRARTALNEKAAKTLRLEKATQVVASLTASLNAIKDLKAQLESSPESEEDFTELAKQLGKALTTLQDLRNTVEGAT